MKDVIKKILSALDRGYDRFFLGQVSLYPIEVLRIGVATLLLIQCVMVGSSIDLFYGEFALTQGSLDTYLNTDDNIIDLYIIAKYLDYFSIPVNLDFLAFGTVALYVVSLVGFLVGWKTRFWAVLVWLLHYILMTSSRSATYGVDTYFHFVLFYFLWFPSGKALSLDAYLSAEKPQWTPFTTIGLRLIQLHLCFTYFVAGVGKAEGYMWWNGEAIWQAFMLPEYQQFDFSFLAQQPWLAAAIAGFTLFIESFYFIFIWIKPIRPFWVLAIVGLHLGIAVFQGLELFGATMAMLTISLFGTPYLRAAAKQALELANKALEMVKGGFRVLRPQQQKNIS